MAAINCKAKIFSFTTLCTSFKLKLSEVYGTVKPKRRMEIVSYIPSVII